MKQKLAITSIVEVREVDPAIFEITVRLEDGSIAVLRMSGFTLQDLAGSLGASTSI